MSSFLTPLEVEYLDGDHWLLHEPFIYILGPDTSGKERVEVPKGFVTDFASVPRPLWNILPPTGKYGKAAVIHDFLYQRRAVTTFLNGLAIRFVERGEADAILNEGMEVLGVSRFTRWIVYYGVRIGGWAAWKRYRDTES